MWHNAYKIVRVRVNHVEAPHEGVPEHEKVNWTFCKTNQTLCISGIGRALNEIVFRDHLDPVVLKKKVDVWKQAKVALDSIHFSLTLVADFWR